MSTTTGPLVITSNTSDTIELTEINSGSAVGYDAAEKVAKVLLDFFSSVQYNHPGYKSGALVVNPASTTGLTFIGSFTDTKRLNAVGSHPVGTSVSSVTYNFYQDRVDSLDFGLSAPDPVHLDNGNLEASDYHSPLDDAVIDAVLDIYVGNVASDVQNGNYVLQPTAPATGTWTSQFTLSNTKVDGSSDTTQLWRKTTAAGLPAGGNRRPLKIENDTPSSIDLKEFSDSEILSRYKTLMMNTMNSGKGQYELSASAPTSGGTWVAAGSAFNDTRYQVANQGYAGQRLHHFYSSASFNVTTFTPTNFSGTRTTFTPFTNTPVTTPGSFAGTVVSYSTRSESYAGSQWFSASYTGLTVQSSTEINETKTLWIRVG